MIDSVHVWFTVSRNLKCEKKEKVNQVSTVAIMFKFGLYTTESVSHSKNSLVSYGEGDMEF